MEIKVEMKKDNVIKSIDENLVSDYLHMGWTKVEKSSKKFEFEEEEQPKISFKKNSRDL